MSSFKKSGTVWLVLHWIHLQCFIDPLLLFSFDSHGVWFGLQHFPFNCRTLNILRLPSLSILFTTQRCWLLLIPVIFRPPPLYPSHFCPKGEELFVHLNVKWLTVHCYKKTRGNLALSRETIWSLLIFGWLTCILRIRLWMLIEHQTVLPKWSKVAYTPLSLLLSLTRVSSAPSL